MIFSKPFYHIFNVKEHLRNKERILNRIANVGTSLSTEGGNPISKSDYYIERGSVETNLPTVVASWPSGVETEWFTYGMSYDDRISFYHSISKRFDPSRRISKTVSNIRITSTWFNQYEPNSGSEHPFHNHWKINEQNSLTSIYYVELEDNSLRTIVEDPKTHKEVDLKVKEGQILTFDATIPHRSPQNNTDTRKTVIAFNSIFFG